MPGSSAKIAAWLCPLGLTPLPVFHLAFLDAEVSREGRVEPRVPLQLEDQRSSCAAPVAGFPSQHMRGKDRFKWWEIRLHPLIMKLQGIFQHSDHTDKHKREDPGGWIGVEK